MTTDEVEWLFEKLGVDNYRHGSVETDYSCPLPSHPGQDRHPSARLNRDDGVWFCHTCHVGGSVQSLVQDVLGEDVEIPGVGDTPEDPVEMVERILAKDTDVRDEPESEDHIMAIRERVLDPKLVNVIGTAGEKYMVERGFEPSFLSRYGMMFDTRLERVCFVVRSVEGRMVGLKGRTIHGDVRPKYFVSPPFFNSSRHLYLLDVAVNSGHKDILVVEGEFDALKLHQYGHTEAVAIGGSHFGKGHVDLLRTYARSVTFWFDDDEAGNTGAETGRDLVSPFLPVYGVWSQTDPASLSQDEADKALDGRLGMAQITVRSL